MKQWMRGLLCWWRHRQPHTRYDQWERGERGLSRQVVGICDWCGVEYMRRTEYPIGHDLWTPQS